MSGDQQMKPGDVFLLHPGVWHGYRADKSFLIYNCCFGQELLANELAWVREDPSVNYLLNPLSTATPRGNGVIDLTLSRQSFRHCTSILDDLAKATRNHNRTDQAANLLLYLSQLARQLGPRQRELAEKQPLAHPAVTAAVHLLRSQFAHPWTLDQLADKCNLDASYLTRLFKKTIGVPPLSYLAAVRLERAAAMLLNSSESIARIGAAVGWEDSNYFCRRFRARVGMTAGEYRARYAASRTWSCGRTN
jgi:AraC family L-rhamnose operon transcriptional activator RhaR